MSDGLTRISGLLELGSELLGAYFDIVGSFVARSLGLVLVGPVTALTGIGPWLVVVAVIMASSSLLAALVPSVRRLERQ